MRSPDQPNSAPNIINGREIGGQGESEEADRDDVIRFRINELHGAFRGLPDAAGNGVLNLPAVFALADF